MARALFLSLPLHGHTNPSLPLVRELVARGDEVVYFSAAPFAARVEETGARFRPYRSASLADLTHLPERMDQLSWLIMRATADVLGQELDGCRAERPDYLITDSVAPWGQWIGEMLGVPVVTSISTFGFNRRVLAYGMARGVRPKSARIFFSKLRYMVKTFGLMRELRRRYGVGGPGMVGSLIGHSDLNIVYTSRYFQPCAESFSDRFVFAGPSVANRTDTVGFPWDQVRHSAVVYVSLGTLFNTDAAFYRHCLEAFGHEDLQVIMSVGEHVSIESLGVTPPNVIVQAHVPQLDVLRRATAFVTHGGMNSVSESLYFGVPVVVIPQMSEQHIVGRRVEELGAGLYLAKTAATVDTLRESVRRLITDDRFRRQAAVVRDSFQTAGGVARAADAILSFTGSRRREHAVQCELYE